MSSFNVHRKLGSWFQIPPNDRYLYIIFVTVYHFTDHNYLRICVLVFDADRIHAVRWEWNTRIERAL